MIERLLNKIMDAMDRIGEGIDSGLTSVQCMWELLQSGDRAWAWLTGSCLFLGLLLGGTLIMLVNSALPFFGPALVIAVLTIISRLEESFLFRFGFMAVWVLLSAMVTITSLVVFILLGLIVHG